MKDNKRGTRQAIKFAPWSNTSTPSNSISRTTGNSDSNPLQIDCTTVTFSGVRATERHVPSTDALVLSLDIWIRAATEGEYQISGPNGCPVIIRPLTLPFEADGLWSYTVMSNYLIGTYIVLDGGAEFPKQLLVESLQSLCSFDEVKATQTACDLLADKSERRIFSLLTLITDCPFTLLTHLATIEFVGYLSHHIGASLLWDATKLIKRK